MNTKDIGGLIQEEIDTRGWSVDTFSQKSYLSIEAIEELLAGSRKVTPIVAHCLALAFGTSKELWINLSKD